MRRGRREHHASLPFVGAPTKRAFQSMSHHWSAKLAESGSIGSCGPPSPGHDTQGSELAAQRSGRAQPDGPSTVLRLGRPDQRSNAVQRKHARWSISPPPHRIVRHGPPTHVELAHWIAATWPVKATPRFASCSWLVLLVSATVSLAGSWIRPGGLLDWLRVIQRTVG